MKKLALVLALCSASTVSSAQAAIGPDFQYAFLQCRDARLELRDAGTTVVLREGGITGMTFARVSEVTILGSQFIGEVAVHSETRRCGGSADSNFTRCIGAPLVYRGQDFELTVHTTVSPLKNGMRPAYLRATVGGHEYDQAMACEFLAHIM